MARAIAMVFVRLNAAKLMFARLRRCPPRNAEGFYEANGYSEECRTEHVSGGTVVRMKEASARFVIMGLMRL